MQRIRKWLWRGTIAVLVCVNVVLLVVWRPYLRESNSQRQLEAIGASVETQALVRPLYENLARRLVPSPHRKFLRRTTTLHLPPTFKVENSKTLGSAVQGFQWLRELVAHGSQHSRLVLQASSGRMPALSRIDLSLSNVTDDDLSDLNFPQLEILRLQDTHVTDEGLGHIVKQCGELRQLNLARTQITLAAVQQCTQLRRLERLDVHSTDLTDRVRLREGSLPALHELHLGTTGVDDTTLASLIGAAPNIRYLDVSGCTVSDGIVQTLSETKIESIDVSHLPISRANLVALAKMPSLRLLICSPDMVDDAFRNDLESRFPKCLLFVRE